MYIPIESNKCVILGFNHSFYFVKDGFILEESYLALLDPPSFSNWYGSAQQPNSKESVLLISISMSA